MILLTYKEKTRNRELDILIIGNGFDLAHGLKTSYKDFLEFCKLQIESKNSEYYKKFATNLWLKHFITRQFNLGNTWIDLESEIYDVIKYMHQKKCFNGSNSFSSINNKVLQIEKNIIDFTLYDIKSFLREPYFNENISKEVWSSELRPYINNFYIENSLDLINLLYKQLREFTKLFEKYLLNEVLTNIKDVKKYRLMLDSKNNEIAVLSFNYTDTYEKLYKAKSIYASNFLKYVYIHGKVCSGENCNLVLGTHSFDRKENDKSLPIDLNLFQKHNQRHRYNTIEPYQEFIAQLTDHRRFIRPVFHIVGHSLDKTDHKILKHILLTKSNAVIKIYYHNEEAQEKLINNITDIIGEDEVMRKVQLIHQHDPDRGILKILE